MKSKATAPFTTLSSEPARNPGEFAGPELATVVGWVGPPGPKKSQINFYTDVCIRI